jgi:hypothetical protein
LLGAGIIPLAMSFDFDAAVQAPFRMQPGLRRLAPGSLQLTPALPGSRHQREKLAVLGAFAQEALCCAAGFDPTPALQALAAQAAAEHPACLQWDGQAAQAQGVRVAAGQVQRLNSTAHGAGEELARCLQALPPAWRLGGLLALVLEEDFAIVDAGGPGPATLPWLAVALPSHWAPREKCGLPFAAAHAPVADNTLLLRAAEGLMQLVTQAAPGTEAARWERFVWTVTPHPRLHALPAHVDPARWGAGFDPARAWWRTERQSFIPVPGVAQAVFAINVQVQPLAAALAPTQAARLHQALASMSPAVRAYRGLAEVQPALLHWLQGQAGDAFDARPLPPPAGPTPGP